jgi:hypothetical protein
MRGVALAFPIPEVRGGDIDDEPSAHRVEQGRSRREGQVGKRTALDEADHRLRHARPPAELAL